MSGSKPVREKDWQTEQHIAWNSPIVNNAVGLIGQTCRAQVTCGFGLKKVAGLAQSYTRQQYPYQCSRSWNMFHSTI